MEKELETVISHGVVKYKGCLIHISKEGFTTGNQTFPTFSEAKEKIETTFSNWNKSIQNANNTIGGSKEA